MNESTRQGSGASQPSGSSFPTRKAISQTSSIFILGSTKRSCSGVSRRRRAGLHLDRSQTLTVADIGASMGFDALYLLRSLSRSFREPLPCDRASLALMEGDQKLIAGGQWILEKTLASSRVDFEYYQHPQVETLPLQDRRHHLAICSEVVEHLEAPKKLRRELSGFCGLGAFSSSQQTRRCC